MHRSRQRGFSLMEITIVMAIVSGLMILVYTLVEETMRTSMFNESHNDLAILSQKAVNDVQSAVLETRVAFEENTTGASYRTAFTLPSTVTVWPGSLLPVFDATGEIEPDLPAQRFTGNSLLLARQLPPLSVTYDHDANSATPEIELLVDCYRFDYFYLARTGVVSFSGSGMSLDFMTSRSNAYADYFQIASLGTTAIRRLTPKLIAAGLTLAWNPGQPIDNSVYTVAGALDGVFDPPLRTPTIAATTTQTLLRGLLGGRISGKMNYSVAFGTYPIRTPVRVFAPSIVANPGFPSGFEVKVTGPSRKRKVMTRLVLMSHYGARSYESQQAFVITAARF